MGHGLQGSGPLVFLVRGLVRQRFSHGSATRDPCISRFSTLSVPLRLPVNEHIFSNFYNNNNNTNNNKTDLLLSKTCMSFILDLHPSTRGTVSRLSNHTSKTLNLHLLGRRHTDKIFGRDTAANPATVHLDSLSVPRPCQFPPIQTHGRLRADSIRGQGPGFWSA